MVGGNKGIFLVILMDGDGGCDEYQCGERLSCGGSKLIVPWHMCLLMLNGGLLVQVADCLISHHDSQTISRDADAAECARLP